MNQALTKTASTFALIAALLFAAQAPAQTVEGLKAEIEARASTVGPDHPSVATSLNNLAELYRTQGQYAQAEPLYKRSLAIFEKALGPDHLDVATSLNNLAVLYQTQGQYAQAEPLYKRSLAISEKVLGPDHPSVATGLNNLAELYRTQGRYAQAEPLYKRSLAISEKALGPDHPSVATSLNNLALLYRTQGQYAQAEPLVKRSLAILEKALGPDHPSVATSLDNLAGLYQAQGRYAQAEPLVKRSLAIREKALGPDHPEVATSLNNLALLYRDQGQYAQAEPLYQRSLAIWEKALGPDHPEVATSLHNLAGLYRDQGQYAQAEPLYQRSLAILEKALGSDHPSVANSLHNLAGLYQDQGQYAQAEPLLKRSLAISEKALGPDHPSVATSLNNLALLYRTQGQYAQAEPLHKRSLAISEKALGPDHPDVATSLHNLAGLYRDQGWYAQAEPLVKRSLAIWEKALGPDHPDVAASLHNLAGLYRDQGQYAQAEPLYQRSLAIREKALGPDHPDVAASLNNLAGLYRDQGQYAQAEPLYQRSLAILEKALGPDHPDVAASLNNLAGLYQAQGQYAQVEPLYQRSLAIWEKALGPDHLSVATSLNNLADLYRTQGQYAQAEPLFKRSMAIKEKALGPDHPSVATSLNNLAALYDDQKQPDKAVLMSKLGYRVLSKRFVQGGTQAVGQLAEQKSMRGSFISHVRMLTKAGGAAAVSESFEASQLAQASSVGQSVAQMAVRFAAKGDELAKVVREVQDLRVQLNQADKALLDEIGQAPDKVNSAKISSARRRVTELEKVLADQARAISTRFPEYDALVSSAPIALAEAQKLLTPDEAMLVYLVGENDTFAWALRPGKADFRKLDITARDLEKSVAQLRRRLDPAENPNVLPYDAAAAHELYKKIFAPVESALDGAKHLIVVADGALQSLPLSVLVTQAPQGDAPPAWLADRYAVSVVPSVSALRALRTFARRQPAPEPFAGFGNPVLKGSAAGQRKIAMRALYVRGTPGAAAGIADVEVIRQAAALPETADELRALAKTLSAPPGSVHLANSATETRAKEMDLSRYRVLAFATHGVMAGEVSGIAEPGLILTPPDKGTLLDDGYLSASEVAQLKLNADWVLLSACNTAAPDDAPGAEGLSGLAKGFFYAGARSLLVSNWYVVSDATVLITTEMLKNYAANPKLGKAEALRQSMQKMRADPKYSHPLFWAPFMVVGEGGAG